jgi:two-component system cell cycle sensor histidine kinase/response regulator CckA
MTYIDAQTTGTPIRALVVDDEEAVRTFVAGVLREAGYETVAAKDGLSACDLVKRTGPPHILVTDEQMPDMPGHDFVRWVRGRHPGVKVLYLTGCSDRLFDAKESLCQDEAFLDKPCSVRGLLQAVSLLLFRQLHVGLTSRLSASL